MREDPRPISPALLERVAASAAGIGSVDGLGAEVERLRTRERSTVLEYRLEGGLRLFAKHYARREDALACYEVLHALRELGFGPGSRYRLAEPLACFPDWGVLLMRVAPGHRLSTLAGRPEWEEGLRGAAGWLAQLHALSVHMGGPREDIAQGVFRLARRAARASAKHPELKSLLVQLIEELGERAGSVAAPFSPAQTHGRYHAGHVYVEAESITVIDLDRVALADPAKDVGEFLHHLPAQARRAHVGDVAVERAALAFLEEYAVHAEVDSAGLVYYWSHSILSTLLRLIELDHPKLQKRLTFYRAEFEGVPSRVCTLSRLVGAGRRAPRLRTCLPMSPA